MQAFTQRDAAARTFDHVFSLATPRDPSTWADAHSRIPCPTWTMDPEVVGQALSSLGKGLGPAYHRHGQADGVSSRPNSTTPEQTCRPAAIVGVLRDIAGHFFPLLAADAKDLRMSPGPEESRCKAAAAAMRRWYQPHAGRLHP